MKSRLCERGKNPLIHRSWNVILKLSLLHGCKNPWISVYIAWVTGYGYKIANCCRNNPLYLSAVMLTLSPLPSKPTTTARFYNAELRLYICMFDSLRFLSVEQYTSFISLLVHTVHLQEKIVCESFNSHIDAMGLPAQECYSISCYYFTAWRTTGLATLESSKRISSASIDKTSISAESTILAVVSNMPGAGKVIDNHWIPVDSNTGSNGCH